MSFLLRFIVDPARTPAFNMAADLHLMEQCTVEPVVTVRFYSWKPPAITLGRLQRAHEQLSGAGLQRDGITWIRRPTGGRAVLHREDLTYSCIFSRSISAMGSDVATTYATITRCLARGLLRCGIPVAAQDTVSPLIKSGRAVKLPCFLAPNRNEIMVQGRKLVGSAQYRSADAVLQHGSLPLTTAYRRLPWYMPLADDERRRYEKLLEAKSISISEIDPSLTAHDLVEALISGFVKELDCHWNRFGWSEHEFAAIERLAGGSEFRRQWCE